MNDPVNNPEHYQQGRMECLDAIEALGLDYHQGQVLKYLVRYKYKHGDLEKQVEDLKKAEFYLKRLIDLVEEQGSWYPEQ